MPRGRGTGLDRWAQGLGRQISRELGQVIAQTVHRILAKSIDPATLSKMRGGAASGGRASGKGACSAPGCGNPVLARSLCRSHYYKQRYQAVKAGTLAPRRRKAGSRKPGTAPAG